MFIFRSHLNNLINYECLSSNLRVDDSITIRGGLNVSYVQNFFMQILISFFQQCLLNFQRLNWNLIEYIIQSVGQKTVCVWTDNLNFLWIQDFSYTIISQKSKLLSETFIFHVQKYITICVS